MVWLDCVISNHPSPRKVKPFKEIRRHPLTKRRCLKQ